MELIDLRDQGPGRIPRRTPPEDVEELVAEIIADVKARGDAALIEATKRFDRVEIEKIEVPQEQLQEARKELDAKRAAALETAAGRIASFARRQHLTPWREESLGLTLGEEVFPVGVAGLYVPGGRYPYPSSVLMTAIPAWEAGVECVTMCTPPFKNKKAKRLTLAAAAIGGVDRVFNVGGAQAIAAMAFGTETIPRADVVVGPGNVYVASAKRQLAGSVAIDMVAGPSEIVVVADEHPGFVSSDLEAQAEHGPDGVFAAVSWDEEFLMKVIRSMTNPEPVAVLVRDKSQAVDVVNEFAPEHLELIFEDAEAWVPKFKTAGAIFLGAYSPVPLGDYIAGSNHVLPTGGAGRFSSGLRTSAFQRTSSIVKTTKERLAAEADQIEVLARGEGLLRHAKSVRVRLL